MSDVAPYSVALPKAEARLRPILPLSVRGLGLTLDGAQVLEEVTFELGCKGCTVLMGANGAGKSLLLRVLHGLIQPSAGAFDWNGMAQGEAAPRQALVFQKPVLLRRTVAANVDFVLKARGKDRTRVAALLDHVGLSHKARQPARLLSGGEQQRLALARALATEPDVLMLDEPTASLDPASVLAIEKIVSEARLRGVRIILITHDIGQAQRMADDVVFLHRGRVVAQCAAPDFFAHPPCAVARDYLEGRIVL